MSLFSTPNRKGAPHPHPPRIWSDEEGECPGFYGDAEEDEEEDFFGNVSGNTAKKKPLPLPLQHSLLQLPPTVTMSGSSSSMLPMEFIQVLIHQHAKTLVALKNLRTEVKSLKDPLLPSKATSGIIPSSLATPPTKLDSGYYYQPQTSSSNCHSSTPPTSGDSLYSLLSLIQEKISTKINGSRGYKGSWEQRVPLGSLDKILGNEDFNFEEFKGIDRSVVRAILKCGDADELRRQCLFGVAKREGLKSRLHSILEENSVLKSRISTLEERLLTASLIRGDIPQKEKTDKLQPLTSPQPHSPTKSLNSGASSTNFHNRSLIPIPVKRTKSRKDKDSPSKGPLNNNNNKGPPGNKSSVTVTTTPTPNANNISKGANNSSNSNNGRPNARPTFFGGWFRTYNNSSETR